jgi:predicted acylesterase/phospholipase RssA
MKEQQNKLGLAFSGGGARAAYQVGCLFALLDILKKREKDISVVVGTSLGALNGLLFASGLKEGVESTLHELAQFWRTRTYQNTFQGSISKAFLRSIKIALLRYRSPGPIASSLSIFDPAPLEKELDSFFDKRGGLTLESLAPQIAALAVMSTIEGKNRKPLLLACSKIKEIDLTGASFDIYHLDQLKACHGLASAALPSVLPSVNLDLNSNKVQLVDGGISDNHPVDPALRLGADDIILFDASGRRWWFNQQKTPHDKRPTWEIEAKEETFCLNPQSYLDLSNHQALGPLLKESVGKSSRDFVRALGPVWPVFRILKAKMGEDLAYEVISYVALSRDFAEALFELGKKETEEILKATKF